DFSEHRGRVLARKDFGPRFSFGIRDYLRFSEDPIELTGISEFEIPSIRIGERNKYTRNIVEPGVTYRFGENRSIRVGYRNQILRNDADDVADLDENAINALLSYRFNIRVGVEIFYARVDRDYDPTVPPEPPRDGTEDVIRGRYTLYLDPRTSVFFQYRYRHIDFDRETPAFVDYDTHEPALGFARDLRENVNLLAQAGYAVRDADRGEDEDGFSGVADLTARYDRLNLSAHGEGGLGENLTSAESLGFREFWGAGLDGSYQLLERLWMEGFFFVERERFTDVRRRDTYWNARGELRYQVFRWLFLSAGYEYNERDSNRPNRSYEDNRFFGRLTGQYDIAERF
ncbi:MAG: outer membrane beta-barrel protein, partial [candidate division Zixibacteria bacterium]|nr:outer membrane beta-barrel protein [candidate division Zixibacteria bacterium]